MDAGLLRDGQVHGSERALLSASEEIHRAGLSEGTRRTPHLSWPCTNTHFAFFVRVQDDVLSKSMDEHWRGGQALSNVGLKQALLAEHDADNV